MPPACADRSGHIDTVVWGIIPLRDASEPTHGHLLICVVRVFVEGEAVCGFLCVYGMAQRDRAFISRISIVYLRGFLCVFGVRGDRWCSGRDCDTLWLQRS